MSRELIRMEGICKYFPGVKALENVDLVVHEGEVHALLGENGAGKSTLIKILNGVYKPDAGSIYVKGEKKEFHSVNDAQACGIGIVFQEFNLCTDVSVAENVFIGRLKTNALGMVNHRQIARDTQKILDEVGLHSIKPTDIVRRMSAAQMQMVEIAKAISTNADVIVFDEPTASLTENETQILFGIIRRLCSQGKGVVYISHRMEELKEKYGHQTTLLGHIDPGELMVTSKEDLIKQCREQIDVYKKDGGFVLATGCEYPAQMDFEHAKTMVEVAKTYGRYE